MRFPLTVVRDTFKQSGNPSRRAAQEANGWQPAKPRPRKVSQALEAYAAMTTSAARGAVRDVSQLRRN